MPVPLLNQLKHLERTTILWRERGKVGRREGWRGEGERDRKRERGEKKGRGDAWDDVLEADVPACGS